MDVGLSIYLTETFGIEEKGLGLYFSVSATAYAAVGLLIGCLADKNRKSGQSVMVLGGIIQLFAFIISAPIKELKSVLQPNSVVVLGMQVSCSTLIF